MSEEDKLPDIVPQTSETQQPGASMGNQRGLDSNNSFNHNRPSRSQPGPSGKTAFIAKKERQDVERDA